MLKSKLFYISIPLYYFIIEFIFVKGIWHDTGLLLFNIFYLLAFVLFSIYILFYIDISNKNNLYIIIYFITFFPILTFKVINNDYYEFFRTVNGEASRIETCLMYQPFFKSIYYVIYNTTTNFKAIHFKNVSYEHSSISNFFITNLLSFYIMGLIAFSIIKKKNIVKPIKDKHVIFILTLILTISLINFFLNDHLLIGLLNLITLGIYTYLIVVIYNTYSIGKFLIIAFLLFPTISLSFKSTTILKHQSNEYQGITYRTPEIYPLAISTANLIYVSIDEFNDTFKDNYFEKGHIKQTEFITRLIQLFYIILITLIFFKHFHKDANN